MKKLSYIIGAALAALAMSVSCTQEVAPLAENIKADQTVVSCEAVNGTAEVKITTDGDWFVTANSASWIKLSPSAGSGNATVKVIAADNVNEYKEVLGPRSATISFVAQKTIVNVQVEQKGENGLDTKTTYKPITKLDEFDPAKSFLLVTKYNGEYYIPTVMAATSKTYQYMYGEKVTVDGDQIVMPNDSKAYKAVAKGSGYGLLQPDGYYLEHQSGYDSFTYPGPATIDAAEVWNLTFDDGKAVFANTETCFSQYVYVSGSTATVEYSGNYTADAVKADASKGPDYLPVLYMSAKASTGETLKVADTTKVRCSATKGQIAVESNRTWKVRNHDSWVKTFTPSGTGNGNIEITFDANPDPSTDRLATFQIIGESTYAEVTLVQKGEQISASDVSVEWNATSAKITVTADNAWTVSTDSTWVTNYTKSGTGDGEINVTFPVNPDQTTERKANFKIKGTAVTCEVFVTQLGGKIDIKDVEFGKSAIVEGQVTAISSTGFILTDDTGSIQYYQSGYSGTYKIGDKLKIACTKVTAYGGSLELEPANITSISEPVSGSYKYPSPKVLTSSDIDAWVSSKDNVLAQYVSLTGTLTISGGKYYNIAVDGTSNQGSISGITQEFKDKLESGKTYEFKGYLVSRSSGKYANMFLTEVAPAYTYKRVNTVTSGKQYLLVFSDNLVLNAVAEAKSYGYPTASACLAVEGVVKGAFAACEYTFVSTAGGYNMVDSFGRFMYIYKDGAKSFNVKTEIPASPENCGVWTISVDAENLATIKNAMDNSWIQYNVSYTSAGSYKTAQTNALMPVLYEKQ